MAFRFFRSFGNKWFRVNVSKRGVSATVGPRGVGGVTINHKGKVTGSVNAPIKGLSYRKDLTPKQAAKVARESQGRPFSPDRYPRRKLEQMHIEALREIEQLREQLSNR
ncbi:DUF4236 domain-containing protein [Vibrio astriarenae]